MMRRSGNSERNHAGVQTETSALFPCRGGIDTMIRLQPFPRTASETARETSSRCRARCQRPALSLLAKLAGLESQAIDASCCCVKVRPHFRIDEGLSREIELDSDRI